MKKIFLAVAILAGVSINAHAVYRYGQTPSQLADKFADSEYVMDAGSRTQSALRSLSGNATFYGYATDYSVKLTTSDQNSFALFWITAGTYSTVVIPTQTIVAGDNTYQTIFLVPVDSPTILNIQLFGQTTANYTIGGYKRDIRGQ